jgi:hypothetical protein
LHRARRRRGRLGLGPDGRLWRRAHRRPRRGRRGRGPLDGLDAGAGEHRHALLLAPVLDHAAGGGPHHARHHAVAHLDHAELHAAHGQRFHDDAADEAGAHLQHAGARLGQGHDGAGVGQVQQGCTPGPLMPGIGGDAGDEPVAISSLSKGHHLPPCSTTQRLSVSTVWARAGAP